MIRTLLLSWAVPAVFSIIVKDPPPTGLEYKYSYNIDDPTTGDSKSQHEVRQGDVVSGSYTVVDPDGTKRTVDYTADSKRGFNAVVRTEPSAHPYAPEKNTIDTDYQYAQVQPKSVYESSQPQYQLPSQYRQPQVQYEPSQLQSYQQAPRQQYEPIQIMPYDPSPYIETDYQPESRAIYFTPSNELVRDDNTFHNGQYFLPAQTH